jgi:deoxyribonuclease IV
VINAPPRADDIGAPATQIFTKQPNQWKESEVSPADARAFRDALAASGVKFTNAHDSYLINLASPDAGVRGKSIKLFIEEVSRADRLGIPYLVTHPGAHLGEGEDVGLRRVAAALDEVHAAAPKAAVITCLEITAGQGTCLGHRLEHLAEIIERVKSPERLGVCLDTAHLFAAGYDFRGRKYAGFMRQVESTVGTKRVKVLHLNDSKKDLGSRVDRHDHIGRGKIGLDGFRPFVRDKRFARVPKILETPKEKDEQGRDWDEVNVETLRSLM